jgi:RNA polymerase sigma factor (TIGR02999 family)
MSDLTRILDAIQAGEPQAAGKLLPLVYDELRRLAAVQMAREKPGQTLDATALVHEAYLRLAGNQQFENRRHFFAAAVEAMRRILVENARRKHRQKRGGSRQRVELDDVALIAPESDTRLLALNEALDRFAKVQPAKAELVKLRWFGGFSLDAAAELLDISPSTGDRWWAYARAWLRAEVTEEKSN